MHHARQHRAARKMLQQFEDTWSLHWFQLFEHTEVPVEQAEKKTTNLGTVTCDRTASSSAPLFSQKISGGNDPCTIIPLNRGKFFGGVYV